MEFKAIVDAKARERAHCAVVGVYEQGDLSVGAREIDSQIGGTIGNLFASFLGLFAHHLPGARKLVFDGIGVQIGRAKLVLDKLFGL